MKTDWGPPVAVTIAVMRIASRPNWNHAIRSSGTPRRSPSGSTRQAAAPPSTAIANVPKA